MQESPWSFAVTNHVLGVFFSCLCLLCADRNGNFSETFQDLRFSCPWVGRAGFRLISLLPSEIHVSACGSELSSRRRTGGAIRHLIWTKIALVR